MTGSSWTVQLPLRKNEENKKNTNSITLSEKTRKIKNTNLITSQKK